VIIGLITFALAEGLVRLVQSPSVNGRRTFLGQPLLPYRAKGSILPADFRQATLGNYVVPDDQIGWSIGKSAKIDLYESNSQGIRAPPERIYAPTPPPGKVRILAVGDSFTHCDDVSNEDTWERALEGLRSDVEVLNLGMPMSGTDQALLRYQRDGRRFAPQISILGIWTENLGRNLNLVYYYFNPYLSTASVFLSKPRFLLEAGKLKLINSPVLPPEVLTELLTRPEAFPLLKDDYWYSAEETTSKFYQHSAVLRVTESIYRLYQRKNRREDLYRGKDPAGIELTVAIAKQFAEVASASGSQPIILLIPMQHHLLEGKMYASEDSFPLARALRKEKLEVVNLGWLLANANPPLDLGALYIRKGGHITAAGNRVIARELEKKLAPFIEKAKKPD
jgi:hypothetical protein